MIISLKRSQGTNFLGKTYFDMHFKAILSNTDLKAIKHYDLLGLEVVGNTALDRLKANLFSFIAAIICTPLYAYIHIMASRPSRISYGHTVYGSPDIGAGFYLMVPIVLACSYFGVKYFLDKKITIGDMIKGSYLSCKNMTENQENEQLIIDNAVALRKLLDDTKGWGESEEIHISKSAETKANAGKTTIKDVLNKSYTVTRVKTSQDSEEIEVTDETSPQQG